MPDFDSAFPAAPGLARNVHLYPWFQGLSAFEAWIPIFFLYFSSFLSLTEVIQLSVIYYVTVFLLEVPSGYCSDRYGRRATLIAAAASKVAACILFVSAGDFFQFAAAQVFMGTGSAFRSGGNTALHYDSMHALSRSGEFARREAIAQRYSLSSLCLAALVGGGAGYFDLSWPYFLTMIASLGSLIIALRFVEPVAKTHRAESFADNLTVCLRLLRDPVLGGLFALVVLMYALEHVPFEFYQAYIAVLEDSGFAILSAESSPILSGIVIAISMLGGVAGTLISVRMAERFGLWSTLACATGIQITVIAVLATWLHPACLALVFVRNLPGALAHAPIQATIAPRVQPQQRATFLSIQAMGSKLGFGILLYAMSRLTGTADLDWSTLQVVLRAALIVGIAATALLVAMRPTLTKARKPGSRAM